jgi:formylglycine-generating enzyme required for sulfatase activity
MKRIVISLCLFLGLGVIMFAQKAPAAPAGFVRVNGGTFAMGSPPDDPNRDSDELRHRVTVSGFYISKYEVTQAEYEAVMWNNPSQFKGPKLPVENVTWFDAIEYCNARSEDEGLTPVYETITIGKKRWTLWDQSANGYRLPTEAEWEYAAKGGASSKGYAYSGSNTAGDVGWHSGNSGNRTHDVGTREANELGLYDMSGNAWEWCWDIYGEYSSGPQTDPTGAVSGSARVVRGGVWHSGALYMRSATRGSLDPSPWLNGLGFRLVRD